MQPANTSADIKKNISQVRLEIAGIEGSLPEIMRRDGLEALYAAQESLRNRESSLRALLDYLPVAEEQERAQAEQDKRRELQQERDDASAEFDQLTVRNEQMLARLFEMFDADWPDLSENIRARGAAAARFSDAVFLLNNRQDVFGANGRLEDPHDDHPELRKAFLAVYRRELEERTRTPHNS